MTLDRTIKETRAFIGSPDTIEQQIRFILEQFGDDIEPSLSMLFGNMPLETAERSLRLFAEQVMPQLRQSSEPTTV